MLNENKYYKAFYKDLVSEFGAEKAGELWKEMDEKTRELTEAHPEVEKKRADMVIPLAAIYKVMRKYYPETEDDVTMRLLIAYGTKMGEKIGKLLHGISSIPGMSGLLWKKMPQIMHKMGGEEAGYKSEFVSETSELCAMNVLKCPIDDLLNELDAREACRAICAMDKEYMTHIRHIRYTRTMSVAEGGEYCDYRLTYDKNKK